MVFWGAPQEVESTFVLTSATMAEWAKVGTSGGQLGIFFGYDAKWSERIE